MFNGQEDKKDAAVSTLPDGFIAVELLTGNPAIDADHQQCHDILKTAGSVCLDMLTYRDCGGCGDVRREHCEGQLLKLLGDSLSFVLEHFKMEEAMMHDSLLRMVDRLRCEAHVEDHAAISSKFERIISALDSMQTIELLRELDTVLSKWLTKHIATHDMFLVNWIEREDSALRSGF